MTAVAMGCPVSDAQPQGRRSRRQRSDEHFPRVADALRAIRKAHNLTQEDMAPIMGLSFGGYRPYERGERELTHVQIERIASALGVPVSSITSRLWPEDIEIVRTRFSHDEAELLKQLEQVPEPFRSQVLRGFRESVAIINEASGLARRN